MNNNEFKKQAVKLIKEYNCQQDDKNPLEFERSTQYGKIKIKVDNDNGIRAGGVYTVYMRFTEMTDQQREDLNRCFSLANLKPYNLKWNIHTYEGQSALNELENRLEDLTYSA